MTHKNIVWNSSYELGIEDIDYQHHFFLNLINRLSDELLKVEDANYKRALISELNAYARFHFISEENMMQREGYPKLQEHRELHRELIDQLSIRQNMLMLRASEKEADEIIDFLVNWFLSHTNHEDRLFADYLHGRKAEPAWDSSGC